jgi:hypothetical protein
MRYFQKSANTHTHTHTQQNLTLENIELKVLGIKVLEEHRKVLGEESFHNGGHRSRAVVR